MAFEGGKIPVLGLSGQQLTQQLTGSAIQNTSIGQGPYASLAAGGATALLNVGLSSALGQEAAGQLGFDLNAGQTFLESQVTPFLSSTVSNLVSNQITQSLSNLGPLGSTLGTLGGTVASAAAVSLVNGIFGTDISGGLGGLFGGGDDGLGALGGGPGGAASRAFPGAGSESAASYGGSVYNLGPGGPDVVFSLRPASGATPQAAGLAEVANGGLAGVVQPTDWAANASNLFNGDINSLKFDVLSQSTIGTDAGIFDGDPLGPLRGTKYDSLGSLDYSRAPLREDGPLWEGPETPSPRRPTSLF